LLVVTSEGILYTYAVDTTNGGECRLEEASTLLESVNLEVGTELFPPPSLDEGTNPPGGPSAAGPRNDGGRTSSGRIC
ncbi:unnamed protein product, partial [Choristocarpus tenellus]